MSKQEDMVPVKASAFDPADFAQRFAKAALARGFRAEPLTEINGVPLVAYTKRASAKERGVGTVGRAVGGVSVGGAVGTTANANADTVAGVDTGGSAGAAEDPRGGSDKDLGSSFGPSGNAFGGRTCPRIYIASGIHGDEPAPPLALLNMLEAGLFDDRATWFLVPLLNPTGYLRGTRENDGGVDLNRDFLDPKSPEIAAHVRWLQNQPPFDLSFCLHEDWESSGFYLYEINRRGGAALADAMLAAAAALGPLEPPGMIDGREALEPGIIRPEIDPTRTDWPEALYLLSHHTRLTYTIETASVQPLEQRLATQLAVVSAAIETFYALRRG